MSKLKLMSILQSRIAKRRKMITFYSNSCEHKYTKRISQEQKEDKAILKQLVEDEREVKKLLQAATKLQERLDILLGWKK